MTGVVLACALALAQGSSSSPWECQLGQGGAASSDSYAHSQDPSEAACGSVCLSDADCLAFDFTTSKKSKACRLYSIQDARLGDGGEDKREYCLMDRAPTPTPPAPTPPDARPNIVFLVVESTDGRAWDRHYQDGAADLPNIRALQDQGVQFNGHYANVPVCCPSRSSFWSGRHAHNIPHNQQTSGIPVNGVWNNFEGLPPNFTERLDQFLEGEGYNVKMAGKTDWTRGSHSENVRLDAWTTYARFPYDISKGRGGWVEETDCVDTGKVADSQTVQRHSDWKTLIPTVKWIREKAAVDSRPFFVYQGMTIVHPAYVTNEYWFEKVNVSKIRVPELDVLEEMHPCDFQSSMLKGCLPPADSDIGQWFYTAEHRQHLRAVYMAMIVEFDAMVGEYVAAVKDSGKYNNSVFIVTSDHGDMQMEHRQFYKMAAYDASARVPMVIMDGRQPLDAPKVTEAKSGLIDIYPTVLTYAGVPRARWPTLDGAALQPVLAKPEDMQPLDRPDFTVSQFHGDNVAMSWFMIVRGDLKLIVWGTGEQHPHQLFNLTADVDEKTNLISRGEMKAHVKDLLAKLQTVVDFKAVATNVANYNHASLAYWVNVTTDWQSEMGKKDLRWSDSWNQDADGSVAAVQEFLANPVEIQACRGEPVWPPPSTIAV